MDEVIEARYSNFKTNLKTVIAKAFQKEMIIRELLELCKKAKESKNTCIGVEVIEEIVLKYLKK